MSARGVVFAPVVDEDDVPGPARLLEDLHDAAHAGAQVARLVVAGDDQRDVGRPVPIRRARRGRHEKMRRKARATSATSPSDMAADSGSEKVRALTHSAPGSVPVRSPWWRRYQGCRWTAR